MRGGSCPFWEVLGLELKQNSIGGRQAGRHLAGGQEETRGERGRGGEKMQSGETSPKEQNRKATRETKSRHGKTVRQESSSRAHEREREVARGTKSGEGLETGGRAGGRVGGPRAPH